MKSLVDKYEKLTKSNIVIEANNEEYYIKFDPANFKHLLGAQYLTDMKRLDTNATQFYNKCKASKITKPTLEKSTHYLDKEIDLRLEVLNNILELFFKTNYFTGNEFKLIYPYSKINSNVILQFSVSSTNCDVALLHTAFDSKTKTLMPVSLYPIDEKQLESLRAKAAIKKRKVYSWKIMDRK